MSTLHDAPVLDNPSESRRSFASTAFPDDFDHADYSAWIDSHNAPLSEAEERAMHLEDCRRCEGAAVPAVAATRMPPMIECECGFIPYGTGMCAVWVKSPKTGRRVMVAQLKWGQIPAMVVINARQAVAAGKNVARFTAGELERLAAVGEMIDAA